MNLWGCVTTQWGWLQSNKRYFKMFLKKLCFFWKWLFFAFWDIFWERFGKISREKLKVDKGDFFQWFFLRVVYIQLMYDSSFEVLTASQYLLYYEKLFYQELVKKLLIDYINKKSLISRILKNFCKPRSQKSLFS